MLHLEDSERQVLLQLARSHLPSDAVVMVFGSRAHGRQLKPHSDLDVCILRDLPLPERALAAFLDACEQSNLPFKVDAVEWSVLSDEFREAIKGSLRLLAAGDEMTNGVQAGS